MDASPAATQNSPVSVKVDFSREVGTIRPLHSVNVGPISYGGMVDATGRFKEAGFPLVRLHDCQWPEPAVVDIHTIFRDFRQDAAQPENYYFLRTDDYLESIVKAGSRIYYRLGESIEHSPRKYDVHPPADYEKWAAICVGIARHYNEGWADGSGMASSIGKFGMSRRSCRRCGRERSRLLPACETTARALKARFPNVKVGGPGAADAGGFKDGVSSNAFRERLRARKKRELPLDFFSWHRYGDEPSDFVAHARGVREMLNGFGLDH
jgi:hypothetical protein